MSLKSKSEQNQSSLLKKLSNKLVRWARASSPWLLHVNTGSCNGCDIEILAALTPRLDAERFGVKLVGSPRHADVMVCTGPITYKMKEAVLKTYEQIPDPKYVIVVGACGTNEGVFAGSYNTIGGIGKLLPVDLYIPACPPKPEAIFYGIAQLIGKIKADEMPASIRASLEGVEVNE